MAGTHTVDQAEIHLPLSLKCVPPLPGKVSCFNRLQVPMFVALIILDIRKSIAETGGSLGSEDFLCNSSRSKNLRQDSPPYVSLES